MADVVLQASQLTDPSGSIVASALAVASAAVSALSANTKVTIDLTGLKGISSSYFNLILQAVQQKFGSDVLKDRLRFRFDTPAQEIVLRRSLSAAQRS